MRCTYCRPDFLTNPDSKNDLTLPEIESLVQHLVEHHGVHKVRLTGGDPTARPDLIDIIAAISSIPGIDDLAMTTNGLTLQRDAQAFYNAGLNRINVSIDALDADLFHRMTGIDGLSRVLGGIDAAIEAGIQPVKLNTVVLKNKNEDQLVDLVRFAAKRGVIVRFIEMMPMGPMAANWAERYVDAASMKARLMADGVTNWKRGEQGKSAAEPYEVDTPEGELAEIGFITPMSCNFCAACNRIRIAADGQIFPCLMDEPAGSLVDALRPNFDPERLTQILETALNQKKQEHPITGFVTMTHIGG